MGSLQPPSRSLEGPWGSLGVPGGALDSLGASLGGSEASLGVGVSATDRFVIYTENISAVFVISPRPTTTSDRHLPFSTLAVFWRLIVYYVDLTG